MFVPLLARINGDLPALRPSVRLSQRWDNPHVCAAQVFAESMIAVLAGKI